MLFLDDQARPPGPPTLSRIWRNVGWLLGGQGFVGLASLVFLAIAARALGPLPFGYFALALTYGQLFSNLSRFESWKGVIRFGALHLASDKPVSLSRLLGFTVALDCASAVAGAVAAVAVAFIIGPLVGWSAELRFQSATFAAILILTSGGTTTGILRLFNRFDLLAYSEAVAPIVRVICALIAWFGGGGVGGFLIAWAVAALVQTIAMWLAALSTYRGGLIFNLRAFRIAVRENVGLWHFMWQTSVSSSLRLLSMQAGTLAVGLSVGPAIAGGFRLADRVATAATKPTEQLARVLYPELAHLVASNDREMLRRLFIRSGQISLAFATLIVTVCATAGNLVLRLVAGPQFTFAQPFLAILALAAAIELSGFILEPWHNAHGGASIVLRARTAGFAIYVGLLIVLLPTVGALGAALAAVASSALIVGSLAIAALRMLGPERPEDKADANENQRRAR